MRVPIPNDMLAPGDSAELWYEVQGTNETILNLAIERVNRALENDARLDYRGYRFEGNVDLETGRVHEFVVFTVRYRSDPRQLGPVVQEASLMPIVKVVALIGGATITILAMDKLRMKETRIMREGDQRFYERVIQDPTISDEMKKEVLEAYKATAAKPPTVGEQIEQAGEAVKGAGIGLGIVLVGLAILAASRRRSAE